MATLAEKAPENVFDTPGYQKSYNILYNKHKMMFIISNIETCFILK